MKQIDHKLENLRNETADEYLKPLKLLDEKLNRRAQVAAKRKEFRIQMIDVCLLLAESMFNPKIVWYRLRVSVFDDDILKSEWSEDKLRMICTLSV